MITNNIYINKYVTLQNQQIAQGITTLFFNQKKMQYAVFNLKCNICISQLKNMLRRFQWVPTIYVFDEKKEK